MKKIELASFVLALLATIGNLNLVTGSESVLVLSISTLGIIYIFSGMNGFQNSLRSTHSFENQKTAFVFKISGYSMALIAIGVLFYQLIWPGSKMMIIAGSLSCLFSLAALFSMQKVIKSEQIKILLPRLIVWTFLGGLFLLISQSDWVAMKYKNHPSVVESFENMRNNPKNDSLRDLFQESKREIK